MSAYEEYLREKGELDAYLAQGYVITGIREDLDGAEVRLTRSGSSSEPAQAVLLLLQADTRKYAASRIPEAS